MRLVLLTALFTVAFPAIAFAQTVEEAANALRSQDPVYVADGAEAADQVDADALRSQIGDQAVYVAVLPPARSRAAPGGR